MKNKKIALLSTFGLVFLSALAAAGSSYAWYQTNRSGSAKFGGATIENQDAELKLTFIGSENGLTDKTPTVNNKFEFDYINRVTDVSGDGINFYKPFWSSRSGQAVAINKVSAPNHYVDLFFKIERINQPGITDGWGLKVYLGEDTKFEALDSNSDQDKKSLEALRFAVVNYENELRANPKVAFVHAPFEEDDSMYIARTDSYSAINVQEIIEAKAAALAAIGSATTVSGVNIAKDNGVVAITGVSREDDVLDAAKILATAVINAEVKSLREGDYSPANWLLVLEAQEDALEAIEDATDDSEVTTAKEDGLEAIGLITKIAATGKVAATKQAAIAVINAHVEALKSTDYSNDDWDAIEDAQAAAVIDVNEAADVNTILSAKNSGISTITGLQSAKTAAKLANVKLAAIAVINAEVDALDVAHYEASKWLEITDAKDLALDEIDDADTIAEVTSAKNTGVEAINAVLPKEEFIPTLAEAKAIASTVINGQVGGLTPANYSTEEWDAIEAEQEDAIENITYANSVGVVKNVKIAASEKIYAIQPSLPVIALSLAKQAAIAEVAARVETLNAAHTYSADAWTEVINAQGEAFTDINLATDLEDIDEAKADALVALNAVIPLVTADDVEAAKKAAVTVINSLVDEIARVAYNQPGYVLNEVELENDAFETVEKQSEASYEIADLMTENEAYVAFRVWIEGTDKDAVLVDGMHGTNGSLGGMFKFNLDIYALTDDVWED